MDPHICLLTTYVAKTKNLELTAGVIPSDLSDHFFTFLSLDSTKKHISHKVISYRDFSENNLNEFKLALRNIG